MSSRDAIVAAAKGWVGTPYRHQASTKGAGADCLGLLRGVWRELYGGEPEPVPAYTPDWAEPQREERLWSAARRHLIEKGTGDALPGDVLLFRMRDGSVAKHLGILLAVSGGSTFVHAYSGHGVIESFLTDPWRRRIVACFAFPTGDD
ncbi:NlpC/P60 family protein [Roseitranquillus sediminis]|uniref:NlpC/P60 family protein n=1 Tax=Roseitranquillus sediminis TaxID=2809051 RepID=UPI001D0C1066|nr:NlpC/P60 family protein [Roseitranquillus sediminis]MBM9595202.1 peptidase [Roseitranquillus sediminis]